MELKEMRDRKAALEQNITKLVNEFMNDTGCAIRIDIEVETLQDLSRTKTHYCKVHSVVVL